MENNNIVLFNSGLIDFIAEKKGINIIFKWESPISSSSKWNNLKNRVLYWELIFKNEKTNKSVSVTEGGNIVVEFD